jgi:hypothetical protein
MVYPHHIHLTYSLPSAESSEQRISRMSGGRDSEVKPWVMTWFKSYLDVEGPKVSLAAT